MGKSIDTIVAIPAAALALALLASCGDSGDSSDAAEVAAPPPGQLFPDAFKGVCSGAPVAAATPYDAAGKDHKALYFETYEDDFMDQSSELPGDWTQAYSPEGDALKAIDLVVCARRTAAVQVKVCDGYENDDKPTQNKVNWHTATYALTVHEATTGKQLAQTTLGATGTDCPMFMSFDGDSETVDRYATPSDSAVADFVRPFFAP